MHTSIVNDIWSTADQSMLKMISSVQTKMTWSDFTAIDFPCRGLRDVGLQLLPIPLHTYALDLLGLDYILNHFD